MASAWISPVILPPVTDELARLRLWLADLSAAQAELQRFAEHLDREESQRANRFHFDRDRTAFILRRGILRELLSQQLGCPPRSVRLRPGLHGKPELAPPAVLRFNTSKSGSLALVGFVEGCELGVDLEEVRPLPERESLVRTILAPDELKQFACIPDSLQWDAFYQYWTRKEAVLKAFGIGLGIEPRDLPVGLPTSNDLAHFTAIQHPTHGRCTLVSLQPHAGFQAAIAATPIRLP